MRASWNEIDLCGRGGIGRRACLRCMYPKGCGGSNPLDRTKMSATVGRRERSDSGATAVRLPQGAACRKWYLHGFAIHHARQGHFRASGLEAAPQRGLNSVLCFRIAHTIKEEVRVTTEVLHRREWFESRRKSSTGASAPCQFSFQMYIRWYRRLRVDTQPPTGSTSPVPAQRSR